MPSILDLRVQLADRVGRVKGLIGYIGANGLLGKVRTFSGGGGERNFPLTGFDFYAALAKRS